ncbi:hypothetical protein J2T09_004398 [Neorhizobium huautlense]|uniref:Uncharacterized protein n=1 Tax=Neorhizobium huautlense TaxID=67774 RepID=A0ABT9PYV1_9HYPH|nr:hypothetical protein [Neorhizobium huautlense]
MTVQMLVLPEPIRAPRVERPHGTTDRDHSRRFIMGRGILLWLLGIPLPIVILLVLFLR